MVSLTSLALVVVPWKDWCTVSAMLLPASRPDVFPRPPRHRTLYVAVKELVTDANLDCSDDGLVSHNYCAIVHYDAREERLPSTHLSDDRSTH